MTQKHSPGDLVANRYHVVGLVGEGGMQQVYAAEDAVLDRKVALKTPKDDASERRFERSARLSAKVNHPNAAKTLDYFIEGETPYLIEEFVEGDDLSIVFRCFRPAMDPYLVARIVHNIAKGVAASHHVGVVHRDLKPSNVMISPGWSADEVKVTDFGIAKMAEFELVEAIEEAGEDAETLTNSKSSTLKGAIPYLSPEMIDNPRKVGRPTDVWSIGAIAYELLSGARPFGRGLKQIHNIIEAETPELPIFVNANPQFQLLGEELYEIICSCLRKDPDKRPDADEIVESCGDLCYTLEERVLGVVEAVKYRSFGFIEIGGFEPNAFFHLDSVYGPKVTVGDMVCLARFPGSPKSRAHPVVRMSPRAIKDRTSTQH